MLQQQSSQAFSFLYMNLHHIPPKFIKERKPLCSVHIFILQPQASVVLFISPIVLHFPVYYIVQYTTVCSRYWRRTHRETRWVLFQTGNDSDMNDMKKKKHEKKHPMRISKVKNILSYSQVRALISTDTNSILQLWEQTFMPTKILLTQMNKRINHKREHN